MTTRLTMNVTTSELCDDRCRRTVERRWIERVGDGHLGGVSGVGSQEEDIEEREEEEETWEREEEQSRGR